MNVALEAGALAIVHFGLRALQLYVEGTVAITLMVLAWYGGRWLLRRFRVVAHAAEHWAARRRARRLEAQIRGALDHVDWHHPARRDTR